MTRDSVDKVASAVLYEGYLLYPYRATSLKNRRRWTFGTLSPPSPLQAQGGAERASMEIQCLLEAGDGVELSVTVRFLQDTGNAVVEREAVLSGILPQSRSFSFPPLCGDVAVSSERQGGETSKLTLLIRNLTPLEDGDREDAIARSMLSTHAILRVRGGRFVSPTDPPERLAEATAGLKNDGGWPVLAGPEGKGEAMLCSPIILYDYPTCACESPGDHFDATEIDEILSLRILTLTDDEKRQIRESDPRARALLERTEALTREDLLRLHGTVTRQGGSAPAAFTGATELAFPPGSRVRLKPRGNADAFDLFLAGKEATVVSTEQDFEGGYYLNVTVDEDPGKDMGIDGKPGHRFFYRPEEVEPL